MDNVNKVDEPDSGVDVGALGALVLLLMLVYVALMYTCWGTLSLSKVRYSRKETI